MALTQDSKKYWPPVQSVVDYVGAMIKPTDKVLDVGPGPTPLARANVLVDFADCEGVKNVIKCDVATERLPFPDNEFDFVWCRHLLEDSWNPFHVCAEISRVGKRGYIETPSVIAELAKGVDVSSPPFRGYHHHRWFVWMCDGVLRFVSKYPFAEYIRFDEERIEGLLKTEKYWNSYCVWEGEIPVKHVQAPLDFVIPRNYAGILSEAIEKSKESTDLFFRQFTK